MATRKITPPDAPEIVSARKAALLCAEWAEADVTRREHGREAEALRKRQEDIAAELMPFVDYEKQGKARTVNLPKWRLEIVEEPPYATSIAFAALKELRKLKGQAYIDELIKGLGTKPKLIVDDLRPAKKKEAAA
jgi:hypothetical protein